MTVEYFVVHGIKYILVVFDNGHARMKAVKNIKTGERECD